MFHGRRCDRDWRYARERFGFGWRELLGRHRHFGGWAAEPPASEEELPLSLVLDAIPELHAYLEDPGSADWEDVKTGAYQAALRLGINVSAWREAREVLPSARTAAR